MTDKKIYHLNDRTHKYMQMAQAAKRHEYLGLPGDYISLYPTEYVFPNMENGRADDFHSSTADMLINVEEESGEVTQKTLEKISKYKIFGDFMYSKGVYTVIICLKNPKNFPKEYKITPTNILRPHYIYFPPEELKKKYENLINKIEQKQQLSDNEALDMAFIPKYIPKKYRYQVTEKLARLYKKAIITDKNLKRDVGVILASIIMNFVPIEKQYQLMKAIDMMKIETDLDRLVYDEYGDVMEEEIEKAVKQAVNQAIKEKDKEIKEKNKEIKNLKKAKAAISKVIEETEDPKIKNELSSILILL